MLLFFDLASVFESEIRRTAFGYVGDGLDVYYIVWEQLPFVRFEFNYPIILIVFYQRIIFFIDKEIASCCCDDYHLSDFLIVGLFWAAGGGAGGWGGLVDFWESVIGYAVDGVAVGFFVAADAVLAVCAPLFEEKWNTLLFALAFDV